MKMVLLVKLLTCKLEDLSLIPSMHIKKPGIAALLSDILLFWFVEGPATQLSEAYSY